MMKRYNCYYCKDMVENPDGEWVKYSDIKGLIKKECGGEKPTAKERRAKRSRRVALRIKSKAELIYCLANNEKLTRVEIGELFGFSANSVMYWLEKTNTLKRHDKIDELEQQGHSFSCARLQSYHPDVECKCGLLKKQF